MDTPLVSVKMITYNHGPYIADAIEGVLMQKTDFRIELVIGEDCSTDDTRQIVLNRQSEHPDVVRVVTSDRNVGMHKNGDRVLRACRGKYIAVCEGDDYWTDANKLQKQIDFLEARPEYSMCCHDVEVIAEGVPKTNRYVKFTGDTFHFDDAVQGHFIPTLSIVYRRELLRKFPPWLMECVSGDIPATLLLLDRGPGRYIHEVMGVKRDNPGGVTQNIARRKIAAESFLDMYKQLDAHTRGRHRDILRWKIATRSLKMAREDLGEARPVRFAKHLLQSLLYDRNVFCRGVRKRLAIG